MTTAIGLMPGWQANFGNEDLTKPTLHAVFLQGPSPAMTPARVD
jgi:hypothetical protein